MRALRSAALLAAIAFLTAGPSAQGLADAARRASAAAPQPAAKKYTNDDVDMAKTVAPPAPAAAAATEAAPDAAKSGAPKPGASAETTPAPAEAVADEAGAKKTPEYVVKRIAALREQMQTKQRQLSELQARGATRDAELVRTQIGYLQKELVVHESRVAPQKTSEP